MRKFFLEWLFSLVCSFVFLFMSESYQLVIPHSGKLLLFVLGIHWWIHRNSCLEWLKEASRTHLGASRIPPTTKFPASFGRRYSVMLFSSAGAADGTAGCFLHGRPVMNPAQWCLNLYMLYRNLLPYILLLLPQSHCLILRHTSPTPSILGLLPLRTSIVV